MAHLVNHAPIASPSLNRRPAHGGRRESLAPQDAASREDEKNEPKKDEKKEDKPKIDTAADIRALVHQFTAALGSQSREIGHLFDINNKHGDLQRDKERREERKSDRHDERLKEITNLLKERPVDRDRIEIPPMAGGGDSEQLFRDSGIRIIERDGNKCVFLDEEEECVCKPKKWRHSEYNQDSRDKLRSLAEHKAISCAKIDLLRCLSVEFRTQVKTWKRFNENCEGDYLSDITSNHIRELLCKKQPVFSGVDLHTMKSVANSYDLSQNLCKGHRDSMARFNDKDVIGKDYTLGHMCYDTVQANVRKYNDAWSKAAFRNREPDPRPTMTLICEKPNAPPEAVQIEMNPPPKETMVQMPSAAVGFPSARGIGGVGGVGGVGGGGPGPGPTFYPQVKRIAPPPPRGPTPFQRTSTSPVIVKGKREFPDVGGGLMPTGMPHDDCMKVADWIAQAVTGRADIREFDSKYKWLSERISKNRTKYDRYLYDWMDSRVRDIPATNWRFTQEKLNYLHQLVYNICSGNNIVIEALPSDNCDRLEVFLDKFNNAWLTGREWQEFWLESNEILRMGLDREEYVTVMRTFKLNYQQGGFIDQIRFGEVKDLLLTLCRKVEDVKPSENCLELMYSIWMLRSQNTVPAEGDKNRILEVANKHVRELIPYMHPHRISVVTTIWSNFYKEPRSISQKQYVWMCWEIYSTCIGQRATGYQSDNICERMDFYLLMDYHTEGLDEHSFREFSEQLYPKVMERVTDPREEEEMADLEREWRELRGSGRGLSKAKWQHFRALIAKWCDAESKPLVTQDRDYCKRILDQIHVQYTTGLTPSALKDLEDTVYRFIQQAPDTTRAGWSAIWETIMNRDFLAQVAYDQFRYFIYHICMDSSGFAMELCVKLDFYLLTTGTVGGLAEEGWQFLQAQMPTMIARMVVRAEQQDAQIIWDLLASQRKVSENYLDTLREYIWAACRLGGGGPEVADEQPSPTPSGEKMDIPSPIPERVQQEVSPIPTGWVVPEGIKVPSDVRTTIPVPTKVPVNIPSGTTVFTRPKPVSPIRSGTIGVKPWQIRKPIAVRPIEAIRNVDPIQFPRRSPSPERVSPVRASDTFIPIRERQINWPHEIMTDTKIAERAALYGGMRLEHMLRETYDTSVLQNRLDELEVALDERVREAAEEEKMSVEVHDALLAEVADVTREVADVNDQIEMLESRVPTPATVLMSPETVRMTPSTVRLSPESVRASPALVPGIPAPITVDQLSEAQRAAAIAATETPGGPGLSEAERAARIAAFRATPSTVRLTPSTVRMSPLSARAPSGLAGLVAGLPGIPAAPVTVQQLTDAQRAAAIAATETLGRPVAPSPVISEVMRDREPLLPIGLTRTQINSGNFNVAAGLPTNLDWEYQATTNAQDGTIVLVPTGYNRAPTPHVGIVHADAGTGQIFTAPVSTTPNIISGIGGALPSPVQDVGGVLPGAPAAMDIVEPTSRPPLVPIAPPVERPPGLEWRVTRESPVVGPVGGMTPAAPFRPGSAPTLGGTPFRPGRPGSPWVPPTGPFHGYVVGGPGLFAAPAAAPNVITGRQIDVGALGTALDVVTDPKLPNGLTQAQINSGNYNATEGQQVPGWDYMAAPNAITGTIVFVPTGQLKPQPSGIAYAHADAGTGQITQVAAPFVSGGVSLITPAQSAEAQLAIDQQIAVLRKQFAQNPAPATLNKLLWLNNSTVTAAVSQPDGSMTISVTAGPPKYPIPELQGKSVTGNQVLKIPAPIPTQPSTPAEGTKTRPTGLSTAIAGITAQPPISAPSRAAVQLALSKAQIADAQARRLARASTTAAARALRDQVRTTRATSVAASASAVASASSAAQALKDQLREERQRQQRLDTSKGVDASLRSQRRRGKKAETAQQTAVEDIAAAIDATQTLEILPGHKQKILSALETAVGILAPGDRILSPPPVPPPTPDEAAKAQKEMIDRLAKDLKKDPKSKRSFAEQERELHRIASTIVAPPIGPAGFVAPFDVTILRDKHGRINYRAMEGRLGERALRPVGGESVDTMIDRLVENLMAPGAPMESRITDPTEEDLGDEKAAEASGDKERIRELQDPEQDLPGEDVSLDPCDEILAALTELMRDPSNQEIRNKVAGLMKQLGGATMSHFSLGASWLDKATRLKNGNFTVNDASIKEIWDEAIEICGVIERVAERSGMTITDIMEQGKKAGHRKTYHRETVDKSVNPRAVKPKSPTFTGRVSPFAERGGRRKIDPMAPFRDPNAPFPIPIRIPPSISATQAQIHAADRDQRESDYMLQLARLESYPENMDAELLSEYKETLRGANALAKKYAFPIVVGKLAGGKELRKETAKLAQTRNTADARANKENLKTLARENKEAVINKKKIDKAIREAMRKNDKSLAALRRENAKNRKREAAGKGKKDLSKLTRISNDAQQQVDSLLTDQRANQQRIQDIAGQQRDSKQAKQHLKERASTIQHDISMGDRPGAPDRRLDMSTAVGKHMIRSLSQRDIGQTLAEDMGEAITAIPSIMAGKKHRREKEREKPGEKRGRYRTQAEKHAEDIQKQKEREQIAREIDQERVDANIRWAEDRQDKRARVRRKDEDSGWVGVPEALKHLGLKIMPQGSFQKSIQTIAPPPIPDEKEAESRTKTEWTTFIKSETAKLSKIKVLGNKAQAVFNKLGNAKLTKEQNDVITDELKDFAQKTSITPLMRNRLAMRFIPGMKKLFPDLTWPEFKVTEPHTLGTTDNIELRNIIREAKAGTLRLSPSVNLTLLKLMGYHASIQDAIRDKVAVAAKTLGDLQTDGASTFSLINRSKANKKTREKLDKATKKEEKKSKVQALRRRAEPSAPRDAAVSASPPRRTRPAEPTPTRTRPKRGVSEFMPPDDPWSGQSRIVERRSTTRSVSRSKPRSKSRSKSPRARSASPRVKPRPPPPKPRVRKGKVPVGGRSPFFKPAKKTKTDPFQRLSE